MKLSVFQKLININTSVFSILFLLASTFFVLSIPEVIETITFQKALWKISFGGIALAFARTLGIVLNQYIDKCIDAKNPRTKSRVLPSNLTSSLSVYIILGTCFVCFVVLCAILGVLYWALLSITLFVLYSYMKRFSLLCHWILGGIYTTAILMNFFVLAQGNLPGYINLLIIVWGISIGLIITANDIIYAIQDISFDRSEGLYSIPARFGKEKSILIASVCLILSSSLYLSLGWIGALNYIFYLLAIFPLGTIFYVFRSYQKIGKIQTGEERCFFLANIYIALSFLMSMFLLFLINMC